MSKVLVDRELLERTVKHLDWDGDGPQTVMQYARQGGSLAGELEQAMTQPAEAEGVKRWSDLRRLAENANPDAEWFRVEHLTCHPNIDESAARLMTAASPATVLDLLAALAAVTAERDGLAAARMAYASEFEPDANGEPDIGSVHANIRALKAERDRLREEIAELWKRIDKFQSQSHGIAALAEIERLRAEAEALRKSADRYETVRKLDPRRYAELWSASLYGKRFDDLVDELSPGAALAAKEP